MRKAHLVGPIEESMGLGRVFDETKGSEESGFGERGGKRREGFV